MKILITGGAGYIGSHTAKMLAESGYELVVIDNLETGFRAAVPTKAAFYEGDIRDKDFLDGVFEKEKPDAVMHFAASSQVGESMAKPLEYYGNNLEGTRVLLECMTLCGVKYLIFSSSAAVYGEPEKTPIKETAKTQPENCYGETKLAMENMMKWASMAHGLSYVSLRYFNACGADPSGTIGEAHKPETHLIPLVLQTANGKCEKIMIFGDDYDTPDGSCIRDYVHVNDLARVHILALDYLMDGGKSDVFNLGNNKGFSVKEVIAAAEKITGRNIPSQVCERRAGDPAMLIASSEKAKAVLGWEPVYTELETIIESAWNWHKSHPDGF